MPEKLKEIRRSSNIGSLMLLLFNIIMIVVGVLLRTIFGGNADGTGEFGLMTLIALLIQYAVVMPLLIPIGNKLQKKSPEYSGFSLKKLFAKPKAPAKKIAKWIFLSLSFTWGAAFISSLLFTLLQTLTGLQLNPVNMVPDGSVISMITVFVGAVVLAPIFEELFFRGAIYGGVKRFGGYLPAIYVGLLFGLFHVNYPQIPFAMVLGICSCFLVAKTGSLIPSILTHLILNIFGHLQSRVLTGIDLQRVQSLDIEYVQEHASAILLNGLSNIMIIGIALAGLIVFIIEMVKNRGEYALENECKDIPLGKRTAAMYLAPVTAITIIFLTAFTVLNALAIAPPWA